MRRKMISFGGMLLLAGAAILATPGSGQAQRGGGGHGGGGHFGGGHIGGARFSGGRIGGARFSGGRIGGARFGGFSGRINRGGYHYGYHPSYLPYSGSYGYTYPSYSPYSFGGSGLTYDSGYDGSYGDVTPSYPDSYQANYPPGTVAPDADPAQPDNTAHVTVSAPSDAEIEFDGTRTTLTGSIREFQSPPLTPGSRYTYEVQAHWNENGHEVTQTQQVGVTAGADVNVSFPVPPRATGSTAKTN